MRRVAITINLNNLPQSSYPVFNNSLPLIPPRSVLYQLKPIGIGTPFVESLTSYTCRLAAAHCLSLGALYEFMLVPSLNKAYLTTPSHLSPASTLNGSFRGRSKNINGTGTLAQEWAEMLETLTLRSDLRFLTLRVLSGVLPHWKLLRQFQAWCPACYEEMRQNEQVIYQPLIWTITEVERCGRHHIRMVNQCPYCHRQLLQITRRLQLGYCSRCGYWLGEQKRNHVSQDNQLTEKSLHWQKFIISNVKALLATLPDLDGAVHKERLVESLRLCVGRATSGNITHFASLLGKPLGTFYGWYLGEVKVPLSDLLRVCYCVNLSILDLLRGANTIAGKRFVVREPTDIPDVAISFRRPKSFKYSQVKSELKMSLEITPPISMAETARRLSYNQRDLYRKFPELCRKISARYREYSKSCFEAERAIREEEIKHAVLQIHAQGGYVTPRLVAEFLNKPSYLGRRDVATIIYRTREILTKQKTFS